MAENKFRSRSLVTLAPLAPARINRGALAAIAASEPGTVVVPERNDIIFGRGSGQIQHPGNAKLYETIEDYLPHYQIAANKGQKSFVVESIYRALRTIGRFVRVDQGSGTCFIASHEQAKSKIGHAIRYKLKLMKKLKKEASVHQITSDESSNSSIRPTANTDQHHQHQPVQWRTRQTQDGKLEDDDFEIFTNDELRSVMGDPGEIDIPTQIPDLEPLEGVE